MITPENESRLDLLKTVQYRNDDEDLRTKAIKISFAPAQPAEAATRVLNMFVKLGESRVLPLNL